MGSLPAALGAILAVKPRKASSASFALLYDPITNWVYHTNEKDEWFSYKDLKFWREMGFSIGGFCGFKLWDERE
ncbi:hypothetical protein ACFXTH_041833 [Malus domestica]